MGGWGVAKNLLFLWTVAEKKREDAIAELPHLSVGGSLCVSACVHVRVCVSLCQ